jgi:hypothetical protein
MEKLHMEVKSGWIVYLDDDNLLRDPYGIALALIHAHSRDEVLLWRFKGGRMVPHNRNFGMPTVERGDIDSGNVMYHSSHMPLSNWGHTRCGDYRTISSLAHQLPLRWVDRAVVGVNPLRQNKMGLGLRGDLRGKVTVVITSSTTEGFRPHWLRLSITQYLSPAYATLVRRVILVWNAPDASPPELPEEVIVLPMTKNSLNNRWIKVIKHIDTDAVLNLDDDTFVSKAGIICMFNWWSQDTRRLVGPFVRKHNGTEYSQDELFGRNAYSMVLPKAMMVHKSHHERYSLLAQQVHTYVDYQPAHCDDIVLNAMGRLAPFRVLLPASSITDYFSACTKKEGLRETTGGLGLQKSRAELRSECLSWILQFFGEDSLKVSSNVGTCDDDGAMVGVGAFRHNTAAGEQKEEAWHNMTAHAEEDSTCTSGFGTADLLRRPW